MRQTDTPYLTDLFAISLRWLALFGLAISLRSQERLGTLIMILLTFPALWNGFMSILAIFNHRIPEHRAINVVVDILSGMALYIAVGRMGTEAFWVALLPLFSSAIYFETRGTIAVVLTMIVLQAGYSFLFTRQPFALSVYAPIIGFNLGVGVLVALINIPIINQLRKSYRSTINRREESERSVQRQERERMRALFEMVETFSGTLNYQRVMETVMDTAMASLKTTLEEGEKEMVGAVLLFGDRNKLDIRVGRGFISHDTNTHLPADQGVLAEVLSSGASQLIKKPVLDPELSHLLSLQERKVALVLPLIRAGNAFGALIFAHDDEYFFNQDRRDTLEMLANQAVISLQNARLYQDLAKEKERLLQTQEDAQKKLARDLHDGPTQSVSGIAMRLNIAREMLKRNPKDAAEELVKIEELARRTTQEIRHMLFTLRPLVLETEGLIAALCAMADKMHDLYQQKVTIDVDPEVVNQLDMPHQTVVFYLAEETVGNARKYAQAPEIIVRLKHAGNIQNIALLEILDNGIGFDVQAVMGSYDRRGSLGMINLRERTELINGLLKMESSHGKGTRVRVFIPLDEEAADRLRNGR